MLLAQSHARSVETRAHSERGGRLTKNILIVRRTLARTHTHRHTHTGVGGCGHMGTSNARERENEMKHFLILSARRVHLHLCLLRGGGDDNLRTANSRCDE